SGLPPHSLPDHESPRPGFLLGSSVLMTWIEAPIPPVMVRTGAPAAMLIFTGTAFPSPSKATFAPATTVFCAARREPTELNSPRAAGAMAAAPMVAALARRSSLLFLFTGNLLQFYG